MKSTDTQKRTDYVLKLFRFVNAVILDSFFIILSVYLTYQAHRINDSIKRIIFAFKLEYYFVSVV